MRKLYVLLAALSGLGCGESAERYDLGDHVVVEVSGSGSASLEVDGRRLWEMARDARPTVRSFDESYLGALAIWEFRREGEVATELSRYRGATPTDTGLELAYESEDGSVTATVTFLAETADSTRIRLAVTGDHDSIAMPARCGDDTTFLGFGEQYNATEQTGEAFSLIVSEQGIGRTGSPRALSGDTHTTYFPMPYYLDARGFGVLVDTEYRVEADVCARDPKVAWLEQVSPGDLEMLVFHGPTPADVIRELGDEVGRPSQPPPWAWQPWIAAQGGQDSVLAAIAALNTAEIPYGAIWSQDWTGPRTNADGGLGVQYRWVADTDYYTDLDGLIDGLHANGKRFLAYANPFVVPSLPDHYDAMDAAGLLIGDPDGGAYDHQAPNGRASEPDLTNAAAYDYVYAALTAMVEDHGIDGWMNDFGEWIPLDAVLSDGSDPAAYHNHFPLDWHRVARDALDGARPDNDYVMIGRSGFTGVQGHSQIYWIGDQETNWSPDDGLPTVVPAMINLGLAAVPYVTHDIGGFSSLVETRTKELFLRWTELGAFTPVFRTHEGSKRDDNWQWDADAETIAHFRRFARVHEALAPELHALSMEARATSMPMVRHLLLEFPDDPEVIRISDEYLLGPDLLVAPVVTEGATTRELYLPEGTWYHVWTGTAYEGRQRVTVDAPIGQPPVFSRGADRTDLREIPVD